jgi:crotonobetaine/carnitine-CoA ligase
MTNENLSRVPLAERTIGCQMRHRLDDSPDRPFLSFEGATWTYRQAEERTQEIARGLRRLGVAKGDHVVLLLANCAEFVFAWFAASYLGAVTIPIDPRQSGSLLEYTLGDSRPRVLITSADLAPSLLDLDPSSTSTIEAVVVVKHSDTDAPDLTGRTYRVIPWEQLGAPGEPLAADRDHRAIGMIMYTSGSSGPAKGVIMPNTLMFSSGSNMVQAIDLRRDDILYAPFPLFHGMSSRIGVLPALLTGAHIVLGARFGASTYWRQVTELGATVGVIVPTITAILMAQPESPYERQHRLRVMFNSKADAAFHRRFGVELVETYGMTEIGHVISAPYAERRPGSAGRRLDHWDIKLVDQEGREVAEGLSGELVVRPRIEGIMMAGYLNKPDKTAEALRDGWFHTGDYGRFDGEGYFYFEGRKAERIRRLGENISAEQVEAVVDRHPAIMESAALPYPSKLGEDDIRIVAALQPQAGLSEAELFDWLGERLPGFMLPSYIELVDDLPRTQSGKVSKLALIRAGLSDRVWRAPQRKRQRQAS